MCNPFDFSGSATPVAHENDGTASEPDGRRRDIEMTMVVKAVETGRSEGRPTRTSEMLREFAASLAAERVSVKEIVDALGDRGLGVLIAIFALPNILPSTVPFGNVATGIPVIVFAIQLFLRVPHLVLPGFIGRRTVSTKAFKALAPRVASVLYWFERLLQPRMAAVTHANSEHIIGVVCIILSIVSTLPIPFGHNLPALGLVLIGLGLIERDGLAILAGATIGLIGSMLVGLVLFGLAHGVTQFLHAHHLKGWL